MKYLSRHLILPIHLNNSQALCCGQLLTWINEQATIFASCQMKSQCHVAKLISEINFMTPALAGDILEFGFECVSLGQSSVTIRCKVRNKVTQSPIASIDKMVFVNINANGLPIPHGMRANAA
ncbi:MULTISPECIES: acyl-CoA thioesterase [Pseudomonadati]|uniref:Acyl-CoA thioesterase n=1 Tax=Shewanella aestuarii TaxID=1028752 RepID=A0ABT0L2C5_9GAMM|nr:hotdog domain-containing protein [Shewanella aestuarii]MCL1117840.1 acyl-CoA thioesterase [Shewanella aestuarii]GGN77361.1 acyl-CoA thioesterase [Shewanella aestuarii]